ncbi:MAG: type II secretion system F family protein [Chloroflexia bacterium]|nr:type II secretion system F family protein [Chloroflexia bacterium]
MSNPVLVMALLVVFAALILLMVGLRARKKASVDDVVERMGRFATREEFLEVTDSSGDRHKANKVAKSLEEMVKGGSMAERLSALLARADVRLTVGELILMRIGSAAVGFALGFFLAARSAPAMAILLGVFFAIAGYAAPYVYLSRKGKKRQKRFVEQLGDTITLMANSLRAGYSLLQTMEMVSRETADPMGTEFRRVVREVGLGISSEDAMANLLRRVPSDDLDLLVTAISIQHEVGGNLAQILTIIGHTIRERVRIKGEIGVLTAQQSISGYVISGMPVAMGGILFVMNPTYLMALFVYPYIIMPIVGAVLVVVGFFVMKRITAIEV